MSAAERPMHYVCTREELKAIVDRHERFWVSNCGCREGKGRCQRSRMDVCLVFREDAGSSGSGLKEISRSQVDAIFREAEEKHLVTRPFRNKARDDTEGCCFCCDDCCGYFADPTEKCDRGESIELTATGECNDCGACADVCYFGARQMVGGKLTLARGNCYGCGLCRDVCPTGCITMAPRT